ncbi:NAD(P)/FAD-dependent oxidoreductase [Gracilinema caldarium]|uniref:phytoene desaturase family protein n=1 Tax=Gracilinema caldarium TaxID=215591 RepID=UPI0026F1FAB3|nr:FAD-dependent oxidoreductase [Gracilinema caldarium]
MMEAHELIVVGGGIAGLTAAAYAAKRGMDVLLIEKNETCGGLINTFSRDGFTFDGGVRALESAGIIKPMLADLGIELPSVKSPVSVGIGKDIITVESEGDLDSYEALLRRTYPESGEDIDRLVSLIRTVMSHMKILYAVDNPLFKKFREDLGYFLRVYLPWMGKFILTLRKLDSLKGPVEEYLAGIIKNPSLRDIVDQHFFKATPTFFAMSYFYLYTDYFYPIGGVGKLPERVQEKLLKFGGKLKTGRRIVTVKPAEKVLVDDHGNSYEYKKLIWAADLRFLYANTETGGLPEPVVRNIAATRTAMETARSSESVFTLFIAADLPPDYFSALSRGHFFYTPSAQGLGSIHRKELASLLERWERLSRATILDWLDRFCRYNTYEISIPVLKDPQAAPPGKTGIIASLLFDYELVKRVHTDGWYDEFKAYLEQKILSVLTENLYPQLAGRILFSFSASPLSIEERVASSGGAIVGWSFEYPIPVTSSMLGVNESVLTAIPDVYQAGQWSYSPTGVPTSIMTGRLAADRVAKK